MRFACPRVLVCWLAASLSAAAPAFSAPQKIGVLLKGKSDFWTAIEKGVREAGTKLGVETIIKAPPSETDVAIQVRLLASLAASDIQALVIAPANKDTLAGPVAALAAKGIKIVVIDSPLSGSAASVFVGTNQLAAGQAAGALLASMVSDGDEVDFFRHDQLGSATQLREMGALDKFRATRPQAIVHSDVYASTESGMEIQRAHVLLAKYPAAKAIFASGTPGTMAMLQVLNEKNLAGQVKLIGFGFNLNPAVVAGIESGVLTGWVAQLPKDVGYKGVEAAVSLLNGKTVAPVISTDFLVVTKANLKDPSVQALLDL